MSLNHNDDQPRIHRAVLAAIEGLPRIDGYEVVLVDASPEVNTPDTTAAGEMRVLLRFLNPDAERSLQANYERAMRVRKAPNN